MRQNLIGKPVVYRLQASINQWLYYGDIWVLENGELIDVRDEAISNGWVSVSIRSNLENADESNKRFFFFFLML